MSMFPWRQSKTKSHGSSSGSASGWSLEALEDRSVPATLMVTNTLNSGAGSFRQALLDSNASTGIVDTIDFDIGTGTQTIAPASALPTITNPVVIDATTQPGFAGTPLIVLNGASAGASTSGLFVTAGGTTIRGFVINGFGSEQIELTGGGNDLIAGNYLGTDATGTTAVQYGSTSGAVHGVYIVGSSNNTIGGTTAADRNLISGNQGDGVAIDGINSTGNVIEGNYIGTDVTGHSALGNYGSGVSIVGTNNTMNIIGGTAVGAGNLLSGNSHGSGVGIHSPTAAANLIEGNLIGTDATGTQAIQNLMGGVSLLGPGNTVGGTVAAAGNIICGNGGGGVFVGSAGATADGNVIEGNEIGTDRTSTLSLGSTGDGVWVSFANNTTITGNTIRGNGGNGVNLQNASRNTVANNSILLNAQNGIFITAQVGTSADNVIRGNLISANGRTASVFNLGEFGIYLTGYRGTLTGTVIQGNRIGTDVTGTTADGNKLDGIFLDDTSNNTIGGTSPGDGNVISGNGQDGIDINGPDTSTSFNVIQGNNIGVDISGTKPLGNASYGVGIFQYAQSNMVGGTVTGSANVIGANGSAGVEIVSAFNPSSNPNYPGAINNVVAGNFIGTDASGERDLGNGQGGVVIGDGPANNTIGGLVPGAGNTIAFNTGNGIYAGLFPGDANSGLVPGTGNAFLSNTIYGNRGLGIDLGPNSGVVLNDSLGHSGPNNYQNYPVLTSALTTSGTLAVTGLLTSTPSTQFTVQFFANDTADQSGYGQGQRLLGTESVTTDATGTAPIVDTFNSGFGVGQVVTAIATDPNGNSSEFSADLPIQVLSGFLVAASPTAAAGQGFDVTVTAQGPSGVVLTGYQGTVHFSSSDPQATAGAGLPADYTFVPADNGVHTFHGVMLKTAGADTITVYELGLTAATGMVLVTVDPGSAATVAVVSGSGQSATVNTPFGRSLMAVVTDQYGNPLPGIMVTFAGPGPGAGVTFRSGTTATTGANGQASVPVGADTTAGGYMVTAAAPGVSTPASFALTNTAGAAAVISPVSGGGQAAAVNTGFGDPLVAVVRDQYGNPVPGAVVTFAGPGSGAGVAFPAGPTATTGADGQASLGVKATTAAGGYTVTSTVSGVAIPASFALTNIPGPAVVISPVSGGGQAATVNTGFAGPLVVLVTDLYGNPVAGVVVTFAGPGSGAGVAFPAGPTATTGADGQASL
ncbi:MAG: repeat-containing protein, partial [Gemmataceae bacterium]|nr:repeat-containing protein [Gemmataceae bacterium]